MLSKSMRRRTILLLITISALAACTARIEPQTPTVVPTSTLMEPQPPTVVPTSTPSSVEPVMDYASLVDRLRAAGLTVDPHLTEESPGMFSAPANIMYLNENYGLSVSVFEYADAAMAKAESAYISPDGEQISIPGRETSSSGWSHVTPHYFRRGRLIVFYPGDYVVVFRALEEALGPQFAGGAAPMPPPTTYNGITLPPPDEQHMAYGIPPAWLITGDEAFLPFALYFSTAFISVEPVDTIPDLPAAALAAGEPAVIVIAGPANDFQATLAPWTRDNALLAPTGQLTAKAQADDNMTVFTLEPINEPGDWRLDVSVTFPFRRSSTVSSGEGDVRYVWRLNGTVP